MSDSVSSREREGARERGRISFLSLSLCRLDEAKKSEKGERSK